MYALKKIKENIILYRRIGYEVSNCVREMDMIDYRGFILRVYALAIHSDGSTVILKNVNLASFLTPN